MGYFLSSALSAFVSVVMVASALVLSCRVLPAAADVVERRIEYKQGDTALVGFAYVDEPVKGKVPGVLVFSDWMGMTSFAKDQARRLANLGYAAFVADVYGGGVQAKDSKEAGELASKFKKDRPLMRKRGGAALEAFLVNAPVDPARIGAIGFCFGGTAALELGRSGAPLAGIVSFHGGLETPDPSLGKNVKGKVLILHGADDPFVPSREVEAFEKEMNTAGTDWQLVKYSKAVHAFTNPAAGSDNSKGAAYNELAAKRAFKAMKDFFEEIF